MRIEVERGAKIPAIYIYMEEWWRAAELLEIIKSSPQSDRFISQLTPTKESWEEGCPFRLVLEDRTYKIFKKEDKHD